MNTPLHLVVGMDGGATRTRCVLANEEGETLARAEGGPGLLGAREDIEVADRIIAQTRSLASAAAVSLPIDAICVGLAGAAGRPEAQEAVEQRIAEASVARRILVVPDFEVAFRDAFGRGGGILIIAGTGSVAVGRPGEGELVRVGGWGALLGDEGSGYRLGLGAVRAAIRAADGRNSPTKLTERLFRDLGVDTPGEVFEWSKRASKAGIAAFAPLVIEEADRGDQAAGEIVARAVIGLIQHAQALEKAALFAEPPKVALVGGLVEPGGLLRDRVVSAMADVGFHTLPDRISPVRGAVRMALEA